MSDDKFEPILNLPKDKRTFVLEAEELRDANKWITEQLKKTDNQVPMDGGRFEYRFGPTGLGITVVIYDSLTKETKNVTNWDWWT